MRYLLQLAYKGTHYHGWQKQENAHTVQAELEKALQVLLRTPVETIGCGRTDTGVHARQFFAHFDADPINDTRLFSHKLDQLLPPDIAAYDLQQVTDDFHARYSAVYREYEYLISHRHDPFLGGLAWVVTRKPSVEAMNDACRILLRHTDFECFSKSHSQVNNFRCDLMEAKWEYKNDLLVFTIRGNRFLRNMVRAIVGTMLETGYGIMNAQGFEKVLESRKRTEAGQSVPAHGLYLVKVKYNGVG
jgi:tRNA pseudouridine38-40 synthase